MEDRELLEMAAKAADIDGDFYSRANAIATPDCYWNPLTDDGDALRLAVKLNLCIDLSGMFVHADCRHRDDDLGYVEENSARNDGCILTATRRAIVRAAALIGESMP